MLHLHDNVPPVVQPSFVNLSERSARDRGVAEFAEQLFGGASELGFDACANLTDRARGDLIL